MQRSAVVEMVALDDQDDVKEINPIHGSGAQAAGYERAIVGGLSSYAWAIRPVVQLFGDSWLALGWSEFSLRRPVYAGDALTATANVYSDDTCKFMLTNADDAVTVEGRAGLGLSPWHEEWRVSLDRSPTAPAASPPDVLPEDAPGDGNLPAMRTTLSVAAAGEWAAKRMGDRDPRYQEPVAWVHPSWPVGQGVQAIRHSMRGPEVGIHLGGRVQHLAPMHAPLDVVIAGRWILHERRKERWWSAIDFVVQDTDDREVAYFRQEAILLPPFAPQ